MPTEKFVAKIGASTDEEGNETPEQVYSAEYDFGDDLAAMSERFGADVVFRTAQSQFVVSLRRIIRTAGEKEGSTPETIQEAVNAWVPGVITRKAKDPVATALNAVAGMTDEQKTAFAASLREELGE